MPTWIVDFIRPPDDHDPRLVRRWRWNVAVLLLSGFLFAVWTRTPWGYVLAGDAERKVREAVEPLQKQISEVRQAVSDVADETKDLKRLLLRKLAADLEREIVDAQIRKCKASSLDAAEYFRAQLSEKQMACYELTHREYKPPSCAEI